MNRESVVKVRRCEVGARVILWFYMFCKEGFQGLLRYRATFSKSLLMTPSRGFRARRRLSGDGLICGITLGIKLRFSTGQERCADVLVDR